LIRDTLPPLFCDKRRFFPQYPNGDVGCGESFSKH
jgi:hypothetical protein